MAAVSNKSEPAKLVDPLSLAKSRVDETMLRRNVSGDADSDDHDEEHDDAEDDAPHAVDNTLPSNTKKRKHKSMYKGGKCWVAIFLANALRAFYFYFSIQVWQKV